MAETQLASPNGAIPVTDPPLTLEERKERLATTLLAKLEQGFQVESQTDTEAILVTKRRRRWFGIAGNGAESRQTTSIDEQGRTRTRPVEAAPNGVAHTKKKSRVSGVSSCYRSVDQLIVWYTAYERTVLAKLTVW